MNLAEKLDQGIVAARTGDKKEARRLLKEVVKTDETQVDAWLWLSKIVDSLEEREICFENILTLEPDNQVAQEGLAKVQAEQAAFLGPAYLPGEKDSRSGVSELPDTLDKNTSTDPYEFDNEWLCPYCLAPTHPADRDCPACRKPFIISRRIEEERTVWLWRAIFLQLTLAAFLPVIGIGIFTLIVKLNGIPSPIPYLPMYFGLPVDQPQHLADHVLTLFPARIFWGIIAFSFYSFVLLVLLYVRVPYGNVLYLISGCILLAVGAVMVISFYTSTVGITIGVIVFLLGASQMLLSYTLWGDFLFQEGRLRLKLDRGVKTSTSLFHSGRKYIKLKMWGLAALHLRQAAFMAPKNVSYQAMLAMVYMQAKRYDLAERTINNIAGFAPNAPEIWQLRKELESVSNSRDTR